MENKPKISWEEAKNQENQRQESIRKLDHKVIEIHTKDWKINTGFRRERILKAIITIKRQAIIGLISRKLK